MMEWWDTGMMMKNADTLTHFLTQYSIIPFFHYSGSKMNCHGQFH